jgi:hypothetical protein
MESLLGPGYNPDVVLVQSIPPEGAAMHSIALHSIALDPQDE